jgi:hypothetical protein
MMISGGNRLTGRRAWSAVAGRFGDIVHEPQPPVVAYTHDALIADQTAAQTPSAAIRSQALHDVVHALRFATSLKKS